MAELRRLARDAETSMNNKVPQLRGPQWHVFGLARWATTSIPINAAVTFFERIRD
jgi:hypothetical protein